jgi:hypothetical protein
VSAKLCYAMIALPLWVLVAIAVWAAWRMERMFWFLP